MQRRHFMKITGLTLASALLARRASSTDTPFLPTRLRLPDRATANLGGQVVTLTPRQEGHWVHRDLEVRVVPTGDRLAIELTAPESAVSSVEMSWTLERREIPVTLNDHWERTYGDVAWHRPSPTEILPWYIMESAGAETLGVGVRTGARSFCSWRVVPQTLSLTLDVSSGGNGVHLGGRTLHAADIVAVQSVAGETAFQTARRFMKIMGDAPRMPHQPVYGINDWYFSYGRNSAKLILEHTELLAPMAESLANRPFSVIDAGWFRRSPLAPGDCAWGDSLVIPNEEFGPMDALAEKIRHRGMRPGLWTRPLCGSHDDPPSRVLPQIPGRSSKEPVLDPTIPENLKRIQELFRTYRSWRYDLVKLDYTSFDLFGKWGFEMVRDGAMTTPGWSFADTSRTNAEIVLDLYTAIREAAGDTILIGCNTFSHLSAGIFELNRTGDDTSGLEWDRTRKMGVNTLAFRGVHHGVFYSADPDCVGLTTKVPWEKNRLWMDLVAHSGTPLFISAQPEATGRNQQAALKDAFAAASRPLPVGEPLDWLESPFPRSWNLDGTVRNFDWS